MPVLSRIRPRSSAPATTAAATSAAGSLPAGSLTSSMAAMGPVPRTSPITGRRAARVLDGLEGRQGTDPTRPADPGAPGPRAAQPPADAFADPDRAGQELL